MPGLAEKGDFMARFNAFVCISMLTLTSMIASPAIADPTAECNDGFEPASTECGSFSRVFPSGVDGTAVGVNTIVADQSGTAVGTQAVAIGGNYMFSDFGLNAVPTTLGATAIGAYAIAAGVGTVAIGDQAFAARVEQLDPDAYVINAADGATAIGSYSTAFGNATAVGFESFAGGSSSLALGAGASATRANSVALGADSVANQANTVSIGTVGGERRIVNLAPGTASTDAVNVSQLTGVSTSVTALQTQVAAFGSSMDGLGSQVDRLIDLRSRDRRDMKQGVASAVAISNAPMPSAPGRVTYALNGAAFRGEYAVGGSLMYRLNTESQMAVGLGVSSAGNKNTAVRVGVAGEF
jgi:trimeric autotransporter adhesin